MNDLPALAALPPAAVLIPAVQGLGAIAPKIPAMARTARSGIARVGPALDAAAQRYGTRFVDVAGKRIANRPGMADMGPAVTDFADGFLSPMPFPPTRTGFAGFLTRGGFKETGLTKTITNAVANGLADLWKTYYMGDINRNWKNDPKNPYYPHRDQPREYYRTSQPNEPPTPNVYDLIPDIVIDKAAVDPFSRDTVYER